MQEGLQRRMAHEIVNTLLEFSEESYATARALEFAVAVNGVTGWPVGVIWEISKDEREGDVYDILHAFNYTPEGKMADWEGVHTREELMRHHVRPGMNVKEEEADLLDLLNYTNDQAVIDAEVYAEEKYGHGEGFADGQKHASY